MSNEVTPPPKVYKAGIGRQIFLWLVFGLILPFFVSMPIMVGMRATYGLISDAASLGAMAILFAIFLIFLGLQIQASWRTRIEVDDQGVNLVVPSWRGPTPFGPFKEAKLAYDDIEAVEQRGELYRALGVLGLRRVSSLRTKDGKRIVLGYVTEDEADAPIPVGVIAKTIAEKGGLQIIDKGTINAGTQSGAAITGAPSWDLEPLSNEQVETARSRAKYIAIGLIAGFLVLVAIGILITFFPDIEAIFK